MYFAGDPIQYPLYLRTGKGRCKKLDDIERQKGDEAGGYCLGKAKTHNYPHIRGAGNVIAKHAGRHSNDYLDY